MRFISKHIFLGLITLLPVVLTIYLLYWFVVAAETATGAGIKLLFGAAIYLPGMGVVASLVLVFVVGLLMRTYLARLLFSKGEKIIYRMPLIKSVYRAIRDFFNFFSPENKKDFEQVVMVRLGNGGMQLIGFVTRNAPHPNLRSVWTPDHVLVYLPMSFNVGGYSILVPRDCVTPIDMNMEEAMRYALTAGITGDNASAG